jgi:cellulose synthase/poly-beta-1,6-N-acetylglucosamine synthase-like glycosyltransferase
MMLLPRFLLAATVTFCAYTYLGYPAILLFLRVIHRRQRPKPSLRTWPPVSIVLPVYNEAGVIAGTLERILALDYPADRRQILVVSDASTDRTREIVSSFADRGVELLSLPRRRGKTAAENAARSRLTGEIIINTDASVRIHANAVKHLVAAFGDPSVGVVSARDVSVANLDTPANAGEAAYVGYEMWLRDVETAVDGIVGASGCLYAIRADLHMHDVPEALSRDFAAALTARAHGWRAVSVPEAICYVPRGASLRQEYARKVRTITRGIGTLVHKRALLSPLRTGVFAWMLFSHKVCRWLLPWALLLSVAALGALAVSSPWARAALVAGGAVGVIAALGWLWSEHGRMPRIVALPTYVVAGNLAVLHAWLRVLGGRLAPVWEPTRRGAVRVG